MPKNFAANSRQILLASAVLLSFSALGARLVWLHVLNRDELLRVVAQARSKTVEIPARRGDILDARGQVLATSRSLLVLGVDPQVLREADQKKWPRLAELLGISLPELTAKFTTKFFTPSLAKPVEPSSRPAPAPGQALVFDFAPSSDTAVSAPADDAETELDEKLDAAGQRLIRYAKLSESVTESAFAEINALGIAGLTSKRIYRRVYPQKARAAHVIGYVDREEKPVTGIERYADLYLHGQNGWLESEKDGKRQELAQFRSRTVAAANGYSVQLSIDSAVQQMVEDELTAIAEKYQPLKATVIVSDPRTGFILAMGNYPTFDLNTYNKLSKEEQGRMRNIAVADQYEPGSVFKIVAAAGALNEGLVTPTTAFDCAIESIEYQGAPNTDKILVRKLPGEDHHFDHPLTVAEIIAHSSNRGAAQLAMRLGDERFWGYARAFGFGRVTGFPVGAEIGGTLPAVKNWDSLTITRMPMGQSVASTPLQMHQAMSAIASGGMLYRPAIIKQIRDASGDVVSRFAGQQGERIIKESTAQTMAYLLMGVASKEGTAPGAAIENYQVAGKTGTAQKLIPVTNARGVTKLEYSKKNHVVSFVGFLPASRPQVAISVIIDDADARCPGGVAYGAAVAAPSFKHLAQQLIPYLDIKPVQNNAPSGPMVALQGGLR